MIRKTLQKIKKLIYSEKQYYVSRKTNSDKWVCFSYITDAFYHKTNEKYMSKHQNKKESLLIVDVFNRLGYNVYVIKHNSNILPPNNLNFDIIFGIEPNFVKLCEMYPSARKIYYATGAYYEHQNSIIKKRTDEFNVSNNCSLPYRRMVLPHVSNNLADVIIQIGSKFTRSTYPEHLQKKIVFIKQTAYTFKEKLNPTLRKISNEYIWFGSSGNILKGIDIVIEYFIKHPELILHIVGPIEKDFITIIKDRLTKNIHIYGFMQISSNAFIDLTQRCNFVIYPSGSEGGMPGAILNMMSLGVIPIVSKWAAFDEILDYGYLLEDLNISSISKSIKWSREMSEETIVRMSVDCIKYATTNYNFEHFTNEFEKTIIHVLKQNTHK